MPFTTFVNITDPTTPSKPTRSRKANTLASSTNKSPETTRSQRRWWHTCRRRNSAYATSSKFPREWSDLRRQSLCAHRWQERRAVSNRVEWCRRSSQVSRVECHGRDWRWRWEDHGSESPSSSRTRRCTHVARCSRWRRGRRLCSVARGRACCRSGSWT